MPAPEKEAIVEELTNILSSSSGIFLTDFTGINVQSMTDMRRTLKESSISYRVVKDSLTRLAADKAGLPQLKEFLTGPIAIAYTEGDPVAPARLLKKFATDTGKPTIKSGLVEGSFFNVDQIDALSKVLPKDEILAKVVQGVQSPIFRLVWALAGISSKLVRTLDAVAKKRQEEDKSG